MQHNYVVEDHQPVKPRIAGLFLMPLRWVCAWILFAAAWRRIILKPESLAPSSPLYEGLKLNHFLPHTDLVAAGLKFLILHPSLLQAFLIIFTAAEATIGILLFLGLCTRLSAIILFFMFGNLMLVAGWLGSTCLDEWTVAALGMAFSLSLFLSGAGPYSLDNYFYHKFPNLAKHAWFNWLVSPELAFIHKYSLGKRYALILSSLILIFTLYTNQHFVGGVYGPFHNPAVTPHLNISAALSNKGELALEVYRNQGPETYGSFIIQIGLKDSENKAILQYDAKVLGQLPEKQIKNRFLVKVAANGHALVVPLSASAVIFLTPNKSMHLAQGIYTVYVTDVSGIQWKAHVKVE